MRVLVTGATGYIGGRLVPRLLELGHRVRVLVRDPERVEGRSWRDQVEIVAGDLTNMASLGGVTEDIDVAYYLVHSMDAGRDFARRDRLAAENFCAEALKVPHVIYIGGLVPRRRRPGLPRGSEHLRSRAEVGRILAARLPTTEFRAGPIIGSGSASFEMVRYVTERVPLMLAPSWVANAVPPIAIRDVLEYLVLALSRSPAGVVEIGAEPLSYRQMMLDYASARSLKRWIFPLPAVLPSWFGGGWVGVMTPIPNSLAIPLIQGMATPLRARRFRAARLFPEVSPVRYKEAVQLALVRIGLEDVETRWSDASGAVESYSHFDEEGVIREERTRIVDAKREEIFRVVRGLGGARGWLTWNWLWTIRGMIDRLLGGPGLRRGRRHRDELHQGEALDFWRVEAIEPCKLLRLRGEARLPGRAWLEWRIEDSDEGTRLVQTAAFAPHGLQGVWYWYLLYPLHRMIFNSLVEAIARRAEQPIEEPNVVPVIVRVPRPTQPPGNRAGVMGDALDFIAHVPPIATRIDFSSITEREDYSQRVMQRLGRDVSSYSVLNLHKIGIDAPARHVFEELLTWNRDSSCWPNDLATIERVGEGLKELEVHSLGKSWMGRKRPGKSLFKLKLLKEQSVPRPTDPDSGRYLLFQCEGGYPIGIFAFYVRSSIPSRGELDKTQVFIGAGFDFYGKERWPLFHPVNRVWEVVHDRVTRNMLNRFKQLCEWRFDRMTAGR